MDGRGGGVRTLEVARVEHDPRHAARARSIRVPPPGPVDVRCRKAPGLAAERQGTPEPSGYREDARGPPGSGQRRDRVPRWLLAERLRRCGRARRDTPALGGQSDERRGVLPSGRRAQLLLPPHALVRDPAAHRSSARQARLSGCVAAARALTDADARTSRDGLHRRCSHGLTSAAPSRAMYIVTANPPWGAGSGGVTNTESNALGSPGAASG